MTTLLDHAMAAARKLTPERQDELARKVLAALQTPRGPRQSDPPEADEKRDGALPE